MWGRKFSFAVAFFLLSPFEQACSRVVLAFCLCQKKANTTREHARFRGDRKKYNPKPYPEPDPDPDPDPDP